MFISPAVKTIPGEQNAVYGSDVNFTCIVQSLLAKPSSVTWSTTTTKNLESQSNFTTTTSSTHVSTLILSDVVLNYSGTYTCTAIFGGKQFNATTELVVFGKFIVFYINISYYILSLQFLVQLF